MEITDNKRVSVIVPVYKVESYLSRCLDSLCSQSMQDIEIILVDDASPDSCGTICNEYAKKDSRIKVIHHNENKGLSAARNTGIENATCDYLMFVDSDDWVHKDYCKIPYECAIQYQADLVMFNYTRLIKPNDFSNTLSLNKKIASTPNGYKTREEAMDLIYGNVGHLAWNKLYRKELFHDITYPVGFFYEDMGTTYKTVWKAQNIYYLDKVLYYYNCIRSGRITSLRNKKALHDWYEVYMQQYRDLKSWGYSHNKLDTLFKHISLGYCIMKNKDMTDSIYVSCAETIKNCKTIPEGFPRSRKILFVMFKYVSPLFEMVCSLAGKKFC